MKEIGPSEIKRILNSHPAFNLVKFKESENRLSYVLTLFSEMFIKNQIKNSYCNLTQFTSIVLQLGFDLTAQQRHEVFLFGLSQQKFNSKTKLFNIINQSRKKIDINLVSQWIIDNIQKIRIKQSTQNISKKIEHKQRAMSEVKHTKLPMIKSRTKLEDKLEPLINIFDTMKKLRQQNGLIPYNFDQDQDSLDVQFNHIPYDSNMADLHVELAQLKLQAEDKLRQIIDLAREDPKIRAKLEEGVQKFQKLRIEANQKIGRAGAVNAQKRLAERRKKQLQKLRTVKFEFGDDIVRASNVYKLLNSPEIKTKPIF